MAAVVARAVVGLGLACACLHSMPFAHHKCPLPNKNAQHSTGMYSLCFERVERAPPTLATHLPLRSHAQPGGAPAAVHRLRVAPG